MNTWRGRVLEAWLLSGPGKSLEATTQQQQEEEEGMSPRRSSQYLIPPHHKVSYRVVAAHVSD